MSSSFAFNPTMSLYIPRVYKNVTQGFITNVFEDKIRFGKVRSVHKVKIPNSKNNYSAIVQFESWNETIVTTNFQTRIFKQGFARVVHNDPWFWIVIENNKQVIYPEVARAETATATATEAVATATEAEAEEGETNGEQIDIIDNQDLHTSQELFKLINSIILSNMKKLINN